jgi:hypothetical protein
MDRTLIRIENANISILDRDPEQIFLQRCWQGFLPETLAIILSSVLYIQCTVIRCGQKLNTHNAWLAVTRKNVSDFVHTISLMKYNFYYPRKKCPWFHGPQIKYLLFTYHSSFWTVRCVFRKNSNTYIFQR